MWWSSHSLRILQQDLTLQKHTCGLCWEKSTNSEDAFLTIGFCRVAWNYQDGEFFSIQSAFLCPKFVVVASHHHWKASPKIRLTMCTEISDFIRDWLCSTGHLHKVLLQHMLVLVVYDFAKAECLGSGFPCWMYSFKLNCSLLFLFHPPNTFLV